ncbi:hypothetical protein LTR12_009106 [Friedmanniomyces endolithicus]|nr:hypothetical protein LTS09_007617 [Friedmanniomyces endolithicus]KAK0346007.1 hypothetical protein LTR94_008410 [Friedmanniomyces endolithicus]KAK0774697.1 hypothetical protein LTR75_016794 [Friedmanniomyces endolithicus]KAK0809061.1 hypothetical protein LTR59_002765 [Friedmanniomyces endolithicus]KAK0850306.1 hypothetical protein LTR03_004768 [Friedmanniomyces endolithicus]
MAGLPRGFVYQKLCIDLVRIPVLYRVVPGAEELEGPYATAVLRFEIDFTLDYPARAPVIKFLCDVFHPLVTPWTTYTHTSRASAADTMSSADEDRLPPGGLTLRHGFPEWHDERSISQGRTAPVVPEMGDAQRSSAEDDARKAASPIQPHIVQVLQYMRVIFDSAELLDSMPLEHAANTSAWHAWRSYRASTAPATHLPPDPGEGSGNAAPKQHQPGGARQPGQWNWQGVWQDRVRKSVSASKADQALFSAGDHSVINFRPWDAEEVVSPVR